MVAQGQSWGRAKVIANSIGTDPNAGHLDHNSYEKDDETNWLNWDEKALNVDLVDYYRGMIAIRNTYADIRDVTPTARTFFLGSNPLSYGFSIGSKPNVLVLINANPKGSAKFKLPEGTWRILANEKLAQLDALDQASDQAVVASQSGLLLVRS